MRIVSKLYHEHPVVVTVFNISLSVLSSFASIKYKVLDEERSLLLSTSILFTLTLIQLIGVIYSIKRNQEIIISKMQVNKEVSELDFDVSLKRMIFELIRSTKACIKKYGSGDLGDIFYSKTVKEMSKCIDEINAIKNGEVQELSSSESDKLWKKVISEIEVSFFTTNFPMYSGLLGKSTDSALLDLQKQAICSMSGKYERIFIYENEEELNELQLVIANQKQIGIVVGCMCLEKFNELASENHIIDRITQKDFSIIDGKYLYLTFLDVSGKKVSKVLLTTDSSKLRAAITFSETLRDAADFCN